MILSYTKSMNTLIVSVATYQTRTKDQIEKGEPEIKLPRHSEMSLIKFIMRKMVRFINILYRL